MTVAGKILADGQLPTTKTALYTVPANATAFAPFFSVRVIAGAATQTVRWFLKKSGSTSREQPQVVIAADESADLLYGDRRATLSAGDVIEGQTTTAAKVDYVISGGEDT